MVELPSLPYFPSICHWQSIKKLDFIHYVRKDKKVKHGAKNYKIHLKHHQIVYAKEIQANMCDKCYNCCRLGDGICVYKLTTKIQYFVCDNYFQDLRSFKNN